MPRALPAGGLKAADLRDLQLADGHPRFCRRQLKKGSILCGWCHDSINLCLVLFFKTSTP
jgi:hypothetical protein